MKNQTANLKSVLNKCLNTVQGSKTYKEKKERKNEHKKERKKENMGLYLLIVNAVLIPAHS